MTQVDGKYILAAGDTATATFTINNPRGDGVPVMGHWSISYDPTVIKVSGGGDGSRSGQLHLIRIMTSSQTITLTITGVSGGESGIFAGWSVWSDPTASPAYQFGVGGGQSIDLAVVGVDIDTDSNNDGTIDHLTDDPVENLYDGHLMTVYKDYLDGLTPVIIRYTGITPMAANEAIGTLKVTDDIRVWADAEMTTLLVSANDSTSWDLYSNTLPATVYVEGLALGNATLEWKLSVNGNEVGNDIVRFTNTTPWSRKGNWTSAYAMAVANITGASLQELADDITGNPGDAALLNVSGVVFQAKWHKS
jgi:hypothetical protein